MEISVLRTRGKKKLPPGPSDGEKLNNRAEMKKRRKKRGLWAPKSKQGQHMGAIKAVPRMKKRTCPGAKFNSRQKTREEGCMPLLNSEKKDPGNRKGGKGETEGGAHRWKNRSCFFINLGEAKQGTSLEEKKERKQNKG